MGTPVIPSEVIDAFATTDGIMDPVVARANMSNALTPLFNRHADGGGGGGGTWPGSITHTQSSPSATWGPIAHTFDHRANVAIFNTAGTRVYAKIAEAAIGSVIITFRLPQSGTAILTP